MKHVLLSVIGLLVSVINCKANTDLDSLNGIWNDDALADTIRIEAYAKYIKKGFLHSNPDSALKLCKKMEDFADDMSRPDWIAEAKYLEGTIFFYQGNFAKALPLFEEGLRLWEEAENAQMVARASNALAVCHSQLGNHARAISHYLRALKTREQEGDSLGVAALLGNMGLLYKEQEQYDRSIAFFNRALAITQNLKNLEREAGVLENLGIMYSLKGEMELSTGYFRKALDIKYRLNDATDLTTALLNIGGHYVKLGKLDSAETYLEHSLQLSRESGLKTSELSALANLGELYSVRNETARAIENTEKAHVLALEVGALDKLRSTSLMLSKLYKKADRPEEALEMYELYISAKDSLQSEKNQRELYKQEYKYQYEKEALTDSLEYAKKEAVMTERSEKQQIGLFAALGGLLLLLALAFAIYSGKKKSDELLLNILPEETAKELKAKGHADAKLMEDVTVLFTDFKGFTALSEQVTPKELVHDLHECFSAFDRICEKHGIEKIKTIGDAYMAAGGIPVENPTHAVSVVNAALEMAKVVEEGKAKKIAAGLPYFEIRIGIHTGPVVAGIVGIKKFQYDIWGDTVNTASRMESSGEVGKVNISESTYALVKDQFNCKHRGKVQAKGKGEIDMYFVENT